jgi:hypothetical protein
MCCYTGTIPPATTEGTTMAKRIIVDSELEDKLNKTLEEMKHKEPKRIRPKSASAYLRDHAPEIRRLMSKGFTVADIIDSLGSSGLSITSATLNKALLDAGQTKKRKKKKSESKKTTIEQPSKEKERIDNVDVNGVMNDL